MSEGLILMAVGMVVVFAALSLILTAIMLMFRFLGDKETPRTIESEAEVGEEAPAPPEKQIDSHLIAILTAAATAALGARVRVYRVGFIGEESLRDHSWVQQARSELHMSHKRKNY